MATTFVILFFGSPRIRTKQREAAARKVPAVKVLEGDLSSNFIAEGTVVPTELVPVGVSPDFTGQVVKTEAEVGDHVVKGQVLAELDSPEAQDRVDKAKAALAEAESEYKLVLVPYRQEEIQKAHLVVEAAAKDVDRAQSNLTLLLKGTRYQLVDRAQADLEAAVSKQKESALQLKRYTALLKQNLIPQADVDLAQTTNAVDIAAVTAATSAVSLAKEGPRSDDIEIARTELSHANIALQEAQETERIMRLGSRNEAIAKARDAINVASAELRQEQVFLDRRFVRAPVDGTIATRSAIAGEIVAPQPAKPGDNSLLAHDQTNMFQIVKGGSLDFLANVDQSDFGVPKAEQDADISVEARPGMTFKARVARISPLITPDTGVAKSLPASTNPNTPYTFNVWLHLAQTDNQLQPGQTGQAIFKRTVHGVWVPDSAVTVFSQSEGSVYMVRNGVVHIQPVVFDQTVDGATRIIRGLHNGDLVIPDNTVPLHDGESVDFTVIDARELGGAGAFSKWPMAN